MANGSMCEAWDAQTLYSTDLGRDLYNFWDTKDPHTQMKPVSATVPRIVSGKHDYHMTGIMEAVV